MSPAVHRHLLSSSENHPAYERSGGDLKYELHRGILGHTHRQKTGLIWQFYARERDPCPILLSVQIAVTDRFREPDPVRARLRRSWNGKEVVALKRESPVGELSATQVSNEERHALKSCGLGGLLDRWDRKNM